MKILVVGGGTGGHVTPIRPVLAKLRAKHPKVETVMIGHSGDNFSAAMEKEATLDRLYLISAGKWRRYTDDSLLQKIVDVRTHMLNIRDLAFIAYGVLQSYRILRQERPDAIFIKGGYVGVPVGFVAARMNIPYMTHDSDVLPGLANRLISAKASINAVGWPVEHYSYPEDKVKSVGIPISDAFHSISKREQQAAKRELGIDPRRPLVLVVGGSLGAYQLNQVMIAIAERLVVHADVVHVAGANNRNAVQKAVGGLHSKTRTAYTVLDFTDKLHTYIAASDVAVTRAGATSFAEFAAMGKSAIFVPAPQLADQAKNVGVLEADGFMVAHEPALIANPVKLLHLITDYLGNEAQQKKQHKLALRYARLGAADEIAKMLVVLAQKQARKLRNG